MTQLDQILAHADANLDASLSRLFELIRIPSVSTEVRYAPDCRRAAGWLTAELIGLDFAADTRDTALPGGGLQHRSSARRAKTHS